MEFDQLQAGLPPPPKYFCLHAIVFRTAKQQVFLRKVFLRFRTNGPDGWPAKDGVWVKICVHST